MNFKNRSSYVNYLAGLREGPVGEQSSIYFDDINDKVVKVFSLFNTSGYMRKKEMKLKELSKLKERFPNAALPEEIIKCEGKCFGYIMPMFKGCTSLSEYQIKARNQTIDLKEILKISCKTAEFVRDLHNEGIIIGDFHPDQFMVKDGDVFICDTDTWGFVDKGTIYEADKVGRPEYIDPLVRNFDSKDIQIKKYTQETDYFSLAVVIFEMLVGFNPFDGKYMLVKGYKRPLRALNGISIIGNHDIKKIDNLKMKHLAWMSKEMQKDFIKIFEQGKRFNILNTLEHQEKDFKYCKKHGYYNYSRYSKCPECFSKKSRNGLEYFRSFYLDRKDYEKNNSDIEKKNSNIYFDYNHGTIHYKDSGMAFIDSKIKLATEEVIKTIDGNIIVKIERVSRVKQFFKTLFGGLKLVYCNSNYKERLKSCFDSEDYLCRIVVSNNDKVLYKKSLFRNASKLKINEHCMLYQNEKKELVKVLFEKDLCQEIILQTINEPFIYEVNEDGDYLLCKFNDDGNLIIFLNGIQCQQLMSECPKVINYDWVSKKWCLITKNANSYNTYIISNTKKIHVERQFEHFSFNGLSIRNSVFYNSMLVIPTQKRVLFLKSDHKLENSTVVELNVGVVDEKSKIALKGDNKQILFIQNKTEIYKIPFN